MFECEHLTDIELTDRLHALAKEERHAGAELVAHLKEFEKRGLHEDVGYTNLFTYCRQVLGMSESSAYKKVRAVEAARRFPEILSMLAEGRVHLETIVLLGPFVGEPDYQSLLREACGKSKREVETLVWKRTSRPDKRDTVKRYVAKSSKPSSKDETPGLFDAAPRTVSPVEATPPVQEGRVRFSFSGSDSLLMKIEKARALLRHKYPEGHLEDIVGEALESFLERRDPERRSKRKASLRRPPSSAHDRWIPQDVKDAVWRRDGGRCAYLRPDGSRCEETTGLEFDHIVPFALGGTSKSTDNIRLLCRGHNQMRARREFGRKVTST